MGLTRKEMKWGGTTMALAMVMMMISAESLLLICWLKYSQRAAAAPTTKLGQVTPQAVWLKHDVMDVESIKT